jgi:urease accessory protein
LAAYRHPEALETIDNDMDAATTCIVAQRASLSQGRALLGVWVRAFRQAYAPAPDGGNSAAKTAKEALGRLSAALQGGDGKGNELGSKGHFAPLWGAVTLAMGLDLQQAAYVFIVNHAKAVLGAAVRASVMGPYRAQSILASQSLQDMILERIEREWETSMEQAGQVVPVLDLWLGRHELLYSRIFNS